MIASTMRPPMIQYLVLLLLCGLESGMSIATFSA